LPLVFQALTIAVRYAAVRRQFASGKNKLETQLLDYPIHQRRLMVSGLAWTDTRLSAELESLLRQPLMAQAIAIGFTSLILTDMFEAGVPCGLIPLGNTS
jgi:acyl-CoA oxidase